MPHTGKQTCTCTSGLGDASHVTCFDIVLLIVQIVQIDDAHFLFVCYHMYVSVNKDYNNNMMIEVLGIE